MNNPGAAKRWLAAVFVALLASAAFFGGIRWGLPSRAVDPFLFGQRPAWSGQQIIKLLPSADEDADRAADVSSRPIADRDRPVVVNASDTERARIVRRYRLMSFQPDEFTTFAALARMKPSRGDLDPRMYKYGGLWVYPVGALLKAASILRLVDLRPDMAWYLDRPEVFGLFYVVARAYSACWGLVGVWAVYALVKRITGNSAAGAVAAICFSLMPLVVNAAHEAKPHLAGAVLMLLAVLAAARFVEGRRSWLAAALVAGAAVAMVPSAAPILVLIPLMFVLRAFSSNGADRPGATLRSARGLGKRLLPVLLALAVAGAVFVVNNPYVVINLVRDPAVLRSNLGNSAAFYSPALSGKGLLNSLLLIGEGTSFLLAAAGIAGTIALGIRALRMRKLSTPDEVRRRAAGLLLAAPAAVVAVLFVLFAKNQPADYARFALPLDVFLLVEAVVAVATLIPRGPGRAASYALLVATTLFVGHVYVHHFLRDSTPDTTRMHAAAQIRGALAEGDSLLVTPLEPAPWSMPPADLFRWTIVVDPRPRSSRMAAPPGGIPITPLHAVAVHVRPVDFETGSDPAVVRFFRSCPICWASKPFEVTVPVRPPGNAQMQESAGGRR